MSKVKMPEKKAPAGAPAYMAQYTALMTILLAFFILLLSMGMEKTGGLLEGVGDIKNLIGLTGGQGVLDFWLSTRRPGLPKQEEEPERPDAALVGYEEGAADRLGLDSSSIDKIGFVDERKTLRLRSSIRFDPGQVRMDPKSQFALDQAIATIYSMQNYHVVVCALVDSGRPEADRLLAAQRAAWLVRHITTHAQISKDRVRALGQVGSLVDEESGEPVEVLLLLRNLRDGNNDV